MTVRARWGRPQRAWEAAWGWGDFARVWDFLLFRISIRKWTHENIAGHMCATLRFFPRVFQFSHYMLGRNGFLSVFDARRFLKQIPKLTGISFLVPIGIWQPT
jgi:hypothetical protein